MKRTQAFNGAGEFKIVENISCLGSRMVPRVDAAKRSTKSFLASVKYMFVGHLFAFGCDSGSRYKVDIMTAEEPCTSGLGL
jgi:hypothetical protein